MLPLQTREWTYPGCGSVHYRDVNASINLKNMAESPTLSVKTDKPLRVIDLQGFFFSGFDNYHTDLPYAPILGYVGTFSARKSVMQPTQSLIINTCLRS